MYVAVFVLGVAFGVALTVLLRRVDRDKYYKVKTFDGT